MFTNLFKFWWKHKKFTPIFLILIVNYFIAQYLVKIMITTIKSNDFKVISLDMTASFFSILIFTFYLTIISLIPLLFKYLIIHSDTFETHEIKLLCWSILTIPLGVVGSSFSYYVVINMILPFFMMFNNFLGVEMILGYSELVSLIVIQGLVFFLFFQVPLVMKLFTGMKLIKKSTLKNNNVRMSIVVILLVGSSWLTPPDPLSLLTVFIPLYSCYELGILIS